VFSADTGSSASGGGHYHRLILKESFRAFTKLGALTSLPTQEGDSLPDGVADLPIDPMEEADTLPEVHELTDKLQEGYPRLYDLSYGKHISIEAETSTIKKPMQTLTNLKKALETERTCIFTCKDATFDDVDSHGFTYWPGRGEKVIYDASSGSIDYTNITCCAEVDRHDNRVFYNKNEKLQLDSGAYAVRQSVDTSNELTWKEVDGEVIVEADDGNVHARFNDPEAVDQPEELHISAYRIQTDDGNWMIYEGIETSSGNWSSHDETAYGPYSTVDELREDWQDIYKPFIPENEFPRMPTDEDFIFVVFPDADNEKHDGPMVYNKGTLEPLFTDEMDVGASIDTSSEEVEDSQEEGTSEGISEGATDEATQEGDDNNTESDNQDDSNDGSFNSTFI